MYLEIVKIPLFLVHSIKKSYFHLFQCFNMKDLELAYKIDSLASHGRNFLLLGGNMNQSNY